MDVILKLRYVIGLILVGLVACQIGQMLKDKQHQPSKNKDDILKAVSEDTSEVVSVSAEDLMFHYRRDAYGANKKYCDDLILPDVPRIPLPPGTPLKSEIVKGKIKRVDKEDLSHLGFVNQFKTTVVLWGADPTSHIAAMEKKVAKIESETKHIESKFERILEQYRLRRERNIVLNGDEIRCLFSRDQTYSLRQLNKGDFVEIRGNVVSNSLGKYGYVYYHLKIENCVLVNHIPSPTKEVTHE